MTNIAVARSSGEIQQLIKTELFKNGSFILIVTTPEAAIECENHGIPYKEIDDYHDLGDVQKINELSDTLSKGWWKSEEIKNLFPEFTSYCGITLGHTIELPFYHVFSEAIRSIFIAQRLLKIEKPDTILIFSNSEKQEGGFWVGFRTNLKAEAIGLVAKEEKVQVIEIPNKQKFLLLKKYKALLKNITRRCFNLIKSSLIWRPKKNESINFALKNKRYRALVYAEGRHGDTMEPLLEEMIRDSELDTIFITKDMSSSCLSFLKEHRAFLFDPDYLWNQQLERKLKKKFKEIKKRWSQYKRNLYLQNLGKKEIGIPFWPLIKFQFHWLFNCGMIELQQRINLAEKTLERLKPNALLIPDASTNALCWILIAQRLDIPCLTQLHGCPYMKPHPTIWQEDRADKVAVWGPLTYEWYKLAEREPENKCVCVGYPLFETYYGKFKTINKENVLIKLKLNQNRPIVLLLVSMTGGAVGSYYLSQFKIYEHICNELSQIESLQLVIRTHQASNGHLPKYFSKKYNFQINVNPDSDLLSLLKIANVVIGQPTTALLEAMLLEKPVLFYGLMMSSEMKWWLENGNIESVEEINQLIKKTKLILENPNYRSHMIKNQRDFLNKMIGPLDGRASKRTIQVVKDMIKDNLRSLN